MSTSRKALRKRHIDWMISYNNPTPIEFFRFIQPIHKSRAIEKYVKILDEAINLCEDQEKQLKLRNLKETVNCNSDWSLWLVEKKAESIRDEIHETNMGVHQELNVIVRNKGKQKINYNDEEGDRVKDNNDSIGDKNEEGGSSNNDGIEESDGYNDDSTDDKEEEYSNDSDINGKEYVDEDKIVVHDILDSDISATQAEQDILKIYHSNFDNCPAMDLRLYSKLSLLLDQELQDNILHEVFDEIDNDYITDEIHNFLTDFFNADHGKQGWCESVRRIVINDKDSELLQCTKELLKGTLGQFVKAFSLDALNPLRDITILERPHLNQFIHPLIDNVLWIFASINYISGEISLQGKARVMVDGAGYLNDVSNYQIICMEGAKPGARNKKNVDDDKKNIKSMIQLFNNIIVSEASERRQIYTGLRVYGATAYKTELSLTMLDFRGTYRLFEVDRFSLPKDWVDMPKFAFMYEALIKWA
ncbi:1944_t:CDS:2, partial [Ambispora gerdemannii]